MTLLHARTGGRGASMKRIFAQVTSRESIVSSLKTFSWLAPLTVLIWVYAERKQVVTTPSPDTIPISVRSNNPNIYVELRLDESDHNVMAQLNGPQVWIDDVRAQIAQNAAGGKPSVDLTVPSNLIPGQESRLDTAELLLTSPVFAHGVTPINCNPRTLRVFVDGYVERDADVQAPGDVVSNTLNGQPVFTPPRVKVRAPASMLPPVGDQIDLEADLPATDKLAPGQHEAVVHVRARNVHGDKVTYTPDTVKAVFEVKPKDQQIVIPSVTIKVAGLPSTMKRYWVDVDPTLTNVTVTGPQEKIAELSRPDGPTLVAWLEVSAADVRPGGAKNSRKLRFTFSSDLEGVKVSEADLQRQVDFRLVEQPPE